MSESPIDWSAVTPCGECCTGCKKKESGFCKGCIESGGSCKEWEQSGGCPIYRCAMEHHASFCGLCPAFPCNDLTEKISWNPHIVEHLSALARDFREQNQV